MLTSLPIILFTSDKIIGYTNEAAKSLKKERRNSRSWFLFRVLQFQ